MSERLLLEIPIQRSCTWDLRLLRRWRFKSWSSRLWRRIVMWSEDLAGILPHHYTASWQED